MRKWQLTVRSPYLACVWDTFLLCSDLSAVQFCEMDQPNIDIRQAGFQAQRRTNTCSAFHA